MKTLIEITGHGIMSKKTILSAIDTTNSIEFIDYGNNDKTIVFSTKKDASKALQIAYKKLSDNKEDWEDSLGSYGHDELNYDAGKAKIVKFNS